MKLLSVAVARSIWLFPFRDLNPRGKSLRPVLEELIKKYRFLKFPQTKEELFSTESFDFDGGVYKTLSGDQLEVRLRVYNDGLVADTTSSTEDSDSFLDDLLMWGSENYGFTTYERLLRRKIYSSELYIQLDHPISLINPAITEFASHLSDEEPSFSDFPFELSGIAFGQDPEKIPARSMSFRLERADGAHFLENRFYSVGPFPTKVHLSFLEKLESIFAQ